MFQNRQSYLSLLLHNTALERKKMIHKILSLCLSLLILCPQAYSKPLKDDKDKTGFITDTTKMDWEPEPFDILAGSVKYDGWILMEGVASPEYGILMKKDDYSKIEYILANSDSWCLEKIKAERIRCDKTLAEREQKCRELNSSLLETKDRLEIELSKSEKDLNKEKTFSNRLMIGGGITIITLTVGIIVTSISAK